MRDGDRHVRERLRALALEERMLGAPDRVERAVMKAWDEAHPTPQPTGRRRARWTTAGAVAATLILACAATLDRIVRQSPAVPLLPSAPSTVAVEATSPVSTPAAMPATGTPAARRARVASRSPAPEPNPAVTMVLVGTPVMRDEQVRLVRVRVATETLRAMGLRSVDSDAETVDVEMLVGEDGVARGFRLGM
jgi:hypothetical protein